MIYLRLVLAMLMASCMGFGQTAGSAGAVERLYVHECGQGRAADQSRWSPGINVGVPIDLANSCYLVKHAKGWMIWDTGVPGRVARMPGGLVAAGGARSPFTRTVRRHRNGGMSGRQ